MRNVIDSSFFGNLVGGERVEAWTLCGSNGLEVEAIDYGATITRILVPDGEGRRVDVALGFRDIKSYEQEHPYFGAIVGRVAGRLSGACFELDGKRYELESNDPPNHLHGGRIGLQRRLWSASIRNKTDGTPCVRFEYQSPDGEEGYPGTVKVAVEYSIAHDNTLFMETTAASDRPTPFSPTSHVYFNLAGESSGSIDGHELQIAARAYVPADENMTLTDQLKATEGSTEDFREPQLLEQAIGNLFRRHGSLYLIGEKADEVARLKCAAQLLDRRSGRTMRVRTTEPFLQFYSGVSLDGSNVGKSGVPYFKHAGLCLECHGYPNGPNCATLGDIILRPGRLLRSTTALEFGTIGIDKDRAH